MNKRQKEILQSQLDGEKKALEELKKVYEDSLKQIDERIAVLMARKDEQNLSSIIYQLEYQKALKKQINGILDDLNSNQFNTVSEYLTHCYENGYIGVLYDIQGQGVPIVTPIDQELVTKAINVDTKLSKNLYARLDEDIGELKKKIAATLSRGIAQNLSYAEIAKQIAAQSKAGMNNTFRIARTEGHRIQEQASDDARKKAKEEGADIVKKWDSVLDGKTRPHHRLLDGQVREIEEDFEIAGMKVKRPSAFGLASEDVNCRCTVLQIARMDLNSGFTKMNNFSKQLESFESPQDYETFKKSFFSEENVKYMNYVNTLQERYNTKDFKTILNSMTDREYAHYSKLLENNPIYNTKGEK